ncbi:MAG: hypothetical protein WBW92_02215 [Rhodanobacteraceae bacterium]
MFKHSVKPCFGWRGTASIEALRNATLGTVLLALFTVLSLAACASGAGVTESDIASADPAIGKAFDLGKTEPGPVVCDKLREQCKAENALRIKALGACTLQARSEVEHCKLGCGCGPEPDGNAEPFKHAYWVRCTTGQSRCESQCEIEYGHSCDALPKPEACAPPIAATCSRCADHPVARVKTCTWPAWPPNHPPGSPVVVPCDKDWSWAGTGACSACRAQAISEVQLGEQTCQCQYPDSQAAGKPWLRTCHFKPQLPELTP